MKTLQKQICIFVQIYSDNCIWWGFHVDRDTDNMFVFSVTSVPSDS